MLTYILIIFAKMIEVSLMTIRTVLITKGERKIGAFIGFFEVTLWILIASTVITNIAEDPLKVVAYALGFSFGNFFGSKVEEKLGIGLAEIKTIVIDEHGDELVEYLRDLGYAVTVTRADGKNYPRQILSMFVQRKKIDEIVNQITSKQSNAVITKSDVKPIYGGYGIRK